MPSHEQPYADNATQHVSWATGGDLKKLRQALGLRENGRSSVNIPTFVSADVASLYKRLDELKESLPWREGRERLIEEWNTASLLENEIEALLDQYGPPIWGIPFEQRDPEKYPDTPVEPVKGKPLAENLLFERDRRLIKHHLLTLVFTKAIQKFLNVRLKKARKSQTKSDSGQPKPSKKRKRATDADDGDNDELQSRSNHSDETPRRTSRIIRKPVRFAQGEFLSWKQVAQGDWSGGKKCSVPNPDVAVKHSDTDTDHFFRGIDRHFKNTPKERVLKKDAQSCCTRLQQLENNPWGLSAGKLIEAFGLDRTLTGRFFNYIFDASVRIGTRTEWTRFLNLLSEAREKEAREKGEEALPKLQPRHVHQAVDEIEEVGGSVQGSHYQSRTTTPTQEEPVPPVQRALDPFRSPTFDSGLSEPPRSPDDLDDNIGGTDYQAGARHGDLGPGSSQEHSAHCHTNAEDGEGEARQERQEGEEDQNGEEAASDDRETISPYNPKYLSYIRSESLTDNRDALNELLYEEFSYTEDPLSHETPAEELWERFHEIHLRFDHLWNADFDNIREKLGDDLREVTKDLDLWFEWRHVAARLGRALQYHPFELRQRPQLTVGKWLEKSGTFDEYVEIKKQLNHYRKLLPWNRSDKDETQFFRNVAKGIHVTIADESSEYYDLLLTRSNAKLMAYDLRTNAQV